MKQNRKILNIIIRYLFILSCPFLTMLLSNRYKPKITFIGSILSFIVAIIIDRQFLRKVHFNLKKLIVSIFISIYSLKYYLQYDNTSINYINWLSRKYIHLYNKDFFYLIFLTISIISFSVLIYFIIDKIIPSLMKFVKRLSTIEKRYIIIISVIGLLISIVLPRVTTAFSIPYHKDELVIYDVIYTSDSGAITYEDSFFNVSYEQNDIRQPLFGVLSLPISIVGKILSELLYMVPSNFQYAAAMTFLQFILLAYTTILIARMLKLKDKEKNYFYLLISCSFPYLVFSILLEQYVIALTYLITACYIYYEGNMKVNYLYVGSVGTLITSGIILPLISKARNIKEWVIDALNCFGIFTSMMIIGGQFPQVLLFKNNLFGLTSSFAKKLSFYEKFKQFSRFIRMQFIASDGFITKVLSHPSYQQTIAKNIDYIGISIVIIAILGFIMNRKNKFAQFCLLWMLFSVILLLLFGWGTAENGLILYSLYFGFSYVSLVFLFIKSTINNKILFKMIIITLCLIMIVFNINELINIFKFSIKFYRIK